MTGNQAYSENRKLLKSKKVSIKINDNTNVDLEIQTRVGMPRFVFFFFFVVFFSDIITPHGRSLH